MSSLVQVIKQIAIVQRAIQGVAVAYDNPPESLDKTPCFVTYCDETGIEWPRTSAVRSKTYDVTMDLYLSRAGNLPTATAAAIPFVDLVSDTFDQNVTLGGTATASGVSNVKVGHMSYAGVTYLGIKFTLKVLVKEQVIYKG